METQAEKQEHLLDIMKGFDTGMLVTRAANGTLRGRPMALAKLENEGGIFLVTSIDSPKVDEIATDEHVALVLQGKTRFASVSGKASVVRDRALIEKLWSDSWKVWFPKGKDDPSICLIAIHAEEGEYWDGAGATGLKLLVEAAKAYVTGSKPAKDENANAKVSLG